jgi:peptidase MA superfamily protein
LILVALAAPAAHALELPLQRRAARVTVRAEDGLGALAAKLAARVARDLERIEADLPDLPHVPQVEVRLVRHMEDIAAVAPAGRGAPPWAAGTAYPDLFVVVVAARARSGDLLDVERTLTHELAHVVLGRALGDAPVPRWLTEGFAYLYSSDISVARASTLFGALIGGRLLPLSQLDLGFPPEENEAALAYAESYDFVTFLARRGRWSDERDDGDPTAFRLFLEELAARHDLEAACERAFGRRLIDVEAEWYESLRSRYLLFPTELGGAALWASGGVLLVLGWRRRRRMARERLAQWEKEEREQDEHEQDEPPTG